MNRNIPIERLGANAPRAGVRSTAAVLPVYVAAIAAAEALGAYGAVLHGMVYDAILVALLLTHYVLMDPEPYRRVLPMLALIPLLRILSVTMPITFVPRIYWYALIGAPLLLATVLAARLLDLGPARLGLEMRSWPAQLLISCTGLPLSFAAFLILRPEPLLGAGRHGWLTGTIAAAILIVFSGFAEELLFRGLLLRGFGELFGRAGLVWSSLLFAIAYLGSPPIGYLLFAGAVGLFFGWCVQRSGSIWGVVMAHSLISIGALLILPMLRTWCGAPLIDRIGALLLLALWLAFAERERRRKGRML